MIRIDGRADADKTVAGEWTLLESMFRRLITDAKALVQLNGDNFLFYNKSLGDLNVEKFTHKHPRSVDGVNDVWHAYPHSSRNLHDIGIARKLDWRLYKRLF
jgi:hypothetical protein